MLARLRMANKCHAFCCALSPKISLRTVLHRSYATPRVSVFLSPNHVQPKKKEPEGLAKFWADGKRFLSDEEKTTLNEEDADIYQGWFVRKNKKTDKYPCMHADLCSCSTELKGRNTRVN